MTVTTVPNARDGLAQVPAGEPYHDASPVGTVLRGAGAGAATGFGAGWPRGLGRATTGRHRPATDRLGARGSGSRRRWSSWWAALAKRHVHDVGLGPSRAAVRRRHEGAPRSPMSSACRSANPTGVVHDVDSARERFVGAAAGATPAWCPSTVQRRALRCGQQEERHDAPGRDNTPAALRVATPRRCGSSDLHPSSADSMSTASGSHMTLGEVACTINSNARASCAVACDTPAIVKFRLACKSDRA